MFPTTLPWSRDQNFESLSTSPHAQMVIVGGGIHGAMLARLAALNGISCILIERGDYASGTSSRSSKMAHGGLRYLENFDFTQVFEGIKSREELFNVAPHICKPNRFLIPVKKGDWWFRLKLGAGLFLYDLMVTKKERKHSWHPIHSLHYEGFSAKRTDLMGCFSYCDGIMNDARLVLENIIHARDIGARCFNYTESVKIERGQDTRYRIIARDVLTAQEYTLTADIVVNCAGPWAPAIGHRGSEHLKMQLRYSAGIHLIFNKPWNQPALFLPLPGRSRYYFVWPHPGGTMVGTTERMVTDLPFEQFPTEIEIEEVLDRIKKDLPDAGLNRETLHYTFAGVRTLPLRGQTEGTATLSRKHIWHEQENVLTLLGGKLTTAAWTSFEGCKLAAKLLGMNTSIQSLSGIQYPGYANDLELSTMHTLLTARGVPNDTATRIVHRLGARTKYLLEKDERCEQISPRLLKGEISLGCEMEQAVTIEDLLRRRTELEYLPGSGLAELEDISKVLVTSGFEKSTIQEQALQYRKRVLQLYQLMGIRPENTNSLSAA